MAIVDFLPICLLLLLPSIGYIALMAWAARVRERQARRLQAEAQRMVNDIRKREGHDEPI